MTDVAPSAGKPRRRRRKVGARIAALQAKLEANMKRGHRPAKKSALPLQLALSPGAAAMARAAGASGPAEPAEARRPVSEAVRDASRRASRRASESSVGAGSATARAQRGEEARAGPRRGSVENAGEATAAAAVVTAPEGADAMRLLEDVARLVRAGRVKRSVYQKLYHTQMHVRAGRMTARPLGLYDDDETEASEDEEDEASGDTEADTDVCAGKGGRHAPSGENEPRLSNRAPAQRRMRPLPSPPRCGGAGLGSRPRGRCGLPLPSAPKEDPRERRAGARCDHDEVVRRVREIAMGQTYVDYARVKREIESEFPALRAQGGLARSSVKPRVQAALERVEHGRMIAWG
jgi:hypothetical protein